MKKKILLGTALGVMLAAATACAEPAYQADIQLFSQSETELKGLYVPAGAYTSINAAKQELGELVSIRYVNETRKGEERPLMTHAFYTGGELWMEGKAEPDDIKEIGRVLTWRTDVETARGLKIGDSFEKIIELYGEPKLIHWNRLSEDDCAEVDRFLIYFCQEPYEKGLKRSERPEIKKLIIGIKGKEVTRLGYSEMWHKGL